MRPPPLPQVSGLMRLSLIVLLALALGTAGSAADAPSPTPPAASPDDLYRLGKELFDENAPAEVKEAYAFPSKEEWDQFAGRLQRALEGDSLEGLAALEPQARDALAAARVIPGCEDYADWLELRIEEIDAAKEVLALSGATARGPTGIPGPSYRIPHYDLWVRRERGRKVPTDAAALMPRLRSAFVSEGVPPELAWLAEVESNLNPAARSPAGARGLFQLMPETARSLGLSTSFPDDRTDPEKSARAAAHYLHALFVRFGTWPLALAAYNAGEGRVSRLLASGRATDFAGVSSALPAETRMYVPKVCALVAVRTGTVL